MTVEELEPLRELAESHARYGRRADAACIRLLFHELDRLTARVAELESPQGKWPVVDVRDGYHIGACPLCGTEHIVGDAAIESEAKQ